MSVATRPVQNLREADIPLFDRWKQWREMIQDPEQKIARPRQVYVGPRQRRFERFQKGSVGERFDD